MQIFMFIHNGIYFSDNFVVGIMVTVVMCLLPWQHVEVIGQTQLREISRFLIMIEALEWMTLILLTASNITRQVGQKMCRRNDLAARGINYGVV